MTSLAERVRSDLFWKVRVDPRAGDLELAKRAGAMPYFLPIDSPVDRTAVIGGRSTLMFGSNNYLGLANDPRVVAAAKAAVDAFGSGCTGSRLMNGTLRLHCELEEELADWVGREAAVVFTAGYLANLAVVSTLCGRDDLVVTDVRNHASLADGAALSGATVVGIRHNDMGQLDAKLGRLASRGQAALAVWDSIFSMDGDQSPLGELAEVCRRHGTRLLVDEAHSLGLLGPEGAGLCRELDDPPDLVMGTFSKSLASCGGFIAGDRDVVDYLRLHARPFLFTASSVPAAVGAALEAVRICRREPWRANHTIVLARRLGEGLGGLGLPVSWGGAAIVGVTLDDELKGLMAWRALLELGVYTNLGVYPAVPRGSAILRLSTTAAHHEGDVDRCLEAFLAAGLTGPA